MRLEGEIQSSLNVPETIIFVRGVPKEWIAMDDEGNSMKYMATCNLKHVCTEVFESIMFCTCISLCSVLLHDKQILSPGIILDGKIICKYIPDLDEYIDHVKNDFLNFHKK